MDSTIIAAVITVLGGLGTALIVHYLNSNKVTEINEGNDEFTILVNTLKRSKRQNVTTDWIEKRTKWDEAKIVNVANRKPDLFHVGVTAETKRTFVRLK